jgi:hypothetical protein
MLFFRIFNSPLKNYILRQLNSVHTNTHCFLITTSCNNYQLRCVSRIIICSLQNFRLEIFKHCFIIPVSTSLINYETHPKRQTHTCVRVNQRWGGATNVVLKLINMTELSIPLTAPESVVHASALLKLHRVCSV